MEMPEDFYSFFEFAVKCVSLLESKQEKSAPNSNAELLAVWEKALTVLQDSAGLTLVGPFDVLAGR